MKTRQGQSLSWPGPASGAMTTRQFPVGWTPSEQIRSRAYLGEVILIRGPALAKADLITHTMRSLEVAWYWTADQDNPAIIDDLYLPEQQTVSASHVSISAEAVASANRAIRRQGKVILGAGHSHHAFGASTSMIDVDLFDQLATEGAGYRSPVLHSAAGRVSIVEAATPESPQPEQTDEPATFRVTFDECPDTELLLTAPAGFSTEDLQIELNWHSTRILSLFSTHDLFQTLHFPQFQVDHCGRCGMRVGEGFLPPASLLIIGPAVLDVEQRRQTLVALEKHMPRQTYWQATTATTETMEPNDDTDTRAAESITNLQFDEVTAEAGPAPFELFRQGEHVRLAVVEAAVLEEAAHRTPALGQVLGWTKTAGPDTPDTDDQRLPSDASTEDTDGPADDTQRRD